MSGEHLRTEVASQPQMWQRAVELVASQRSALPAPGAKVAVIGCGTSWFIAQAYASLRECAGAGWTDAFTATEHRDLAQYDAVVAITRSGTTTEIIEVMEQLHGKIPVTVLLADRNTRAAELATSVVTLDFADEISVVQTRFATSALAFLRASLGESLDAAIVQAQTELDTPLSADLRKAVNAEQITFLGRGWTIGLATEAALKLRESTQGWTESYPAMEYRHGPIAIAAPGRVTWMLGELPVGLAADVAATGAHLISSDLDPMVELLRVHRVCIERAERLGLNPDQPRNLSRSVILAN